MFLINLPAMALLLVLGPILLPHGERREHPLDLPSSALSLAGILCTVLGIKQWAAEGFELRWVISIAIGAAVLGAFAHRQLHHADPMLPPALLRNRN